MALRDALEKKLGVLQQRSLIGLMTWYIGTWQISPMQTSNGASASKMDDSDSNPSDWSAEVNSCS